MKEFKQAKADYQSTPIPEELNDRIQMGIRQGRSAYQKKVASRRLKHWGVSFAACFAVLVTALNLSPTVAAAAAEVPVLGGLFQVLTVRSYHEENDNTVISVDQPAVDGETPLIQRINAQIDQRVAEKEAEGRQIVEEYKEAYLATGGTQEEWDQRPAAVVNVSYKILSQTDATVSFVLNSYVSIFNSTEEQVFYNLDLVNDRELTLADMLGESWMDRCNEAVTAQIAAREDADMFFPADMGGFTTVEETTPFYLNDAGDVVLVFPRYSIAAGAVGAVEITVEV